MKINFANGGGLYLFKGIQGGVYSDMCDLTILFCGSGGNKNLREDVNNLYKIKKLQTLEKKYTGYNGILTQTKCFRE